MDRVRDALVLAATVREAPIEPASAVRARGNRMALRHRALGAGATLVIVLAVGAGVLRLSDTADKGAPAPPAASTLLPSPSISPTTGTRGAPVIENGLCGYGRACATGTGSFRSTLAPAAQHASRNLVVSYDVPAGWGLWEIAPGGLLVHEGRDASTAGTVGVYWPLAPLVGGGDAHAAASVMAALPGSLSSTPEQVSVSGWAAWRVTFAGDARSLAAPDQTVARFKCIVPSTSGYPGLDSEGRCLAVARTVDGPNSMSVGIAGVNPVEVTFVDVPDSDATGGSAILGIWRSAADLASDSAGQSVVDSIEVETTKN